MLKMKRHESSSKMKNVRIKWIGTQLKFQWDKWLWSALKSWKYTTTCRLFYLTADSRHFNFLAVINNAYLTVMWQESERERDLSIYAEDINNTMINLQKIIYLSLFMGHITYHSIAQDRTLEYKKENGVSYIIALSISYHNTVRYKNHEIHNAGVYILHAIGSAI